MLEPKAKRMNLEQIKKLYLEIGGTLHGIIACQTGSLESADDVLQDIFRNFIRLNSEGRTFENPRHYLYSAAKKSSLHERRKARRFSKLHELEENVARQQYPESKEAGGEEQSQLRRAVDSLPEEQREVILMKVHQKMTFQEIGQWLEIPAQTASSRYQLALEKLRQKLTGKRG